MRPVELSRDEDFEARFWDVIGLYLNPPDRALVLCCDERTHRLALQRTEPGLPLGIGSMPTPVRAFVRHGIAKLFAALYYLDGKITSRVAARRDHDEWLKFLDQIHGETPRGLQLHLIADNNGADERPEPEQWLVEHPRFRVQVVPASSSWLDHVEHLFRNLGQDAMGKGSFGGLRDLTSAIEVHLSRRDLEPEPYRWCTKRADILAKLERARELQS